MRIKLLQLVLIFVLLFPPTATVKTAAFASSGWEPTVQAGGPTQGIAVQGNYAYIGVGPRLIVIDISNPANPHPVGATAPFDDLVQGVTVSGALAYVAAGSAGLYIVNIAAPTNPFQVGTWNSPGFAEGVSISGSTAFLADGPYGLRLVDVTNSTAPVEKAHAFDMNYVYDVAVSGRYAYLAAGGAGLLVVEISNPSYPVELGTLDTPGNARGIVTSNGLVWVADERRGMQVINAIDPLHPVLVGSLQTQGWAFDITISGSLAYVAAAFGGLRVVNISDPTHPVEVGGLSWKQNNAVGGVVAGTRVYLADRKNGLRVVEVSNPASPVQTGYWNIFSFAHSIEVSGNYAYVAAGFNGIRIFNLSDPLHPVEVGSFTADGFFYSIKLAGNYLYAGTFLGSPGNGLYALDISNPTQPQVAGFYADIEECWGIDVAGSMVYVADVNGLKVFDFHNPPNLNLVGSFPFTSTGAITVRDGLAYLSKGYDGVEIYNVVNPAAISLVGSFSSSTSFTHGPVALAGNYAYVSDHWGLRILNITNPANPTEVSYTPTYEGTNWLVLNSGRVYISEGSYGISVYDVSNPSAPQLLNQIPVVGAVQALAFNNEKLFATSGEGGLLVFTATGLGAQTHPSPEPLTDNKALPMIIRVPVRQTPRVFVLQDIPASPLPPPGRLASICTVTSAANSGTGTLRRCLENQVAGDLITFSAAVFPPSAPVTIHVGPERLPWLTRGNITIDASNAGVILDGSSVLADWDAGIGMNSDNNIVRGLQIVHFPMGINILGDNNLIGGSRLVGSGPTGQGNVVSGNRGDGIGIYLGAQGNIVLGNLVGLNATGTQANPNQWAGVSINQSPNNTIGSLNPGEGNIISANRDTGISLYGYATLGNKIIGNKIGSDITGNLNLGNQNAGMLVWSGTSETLIHGNLVSGNSRAEIIVWDFMTDFNVMTGNKIGTNLAGSAPLPNLTSTGIAVGSAAYTRIGGTASGEGNVVANPAGVSVEGPFNADTLVMGNRFGVNAAGNAVLPGAGGLRLGGATRTIVGGSTPAEANWITTDGHFSLDLRSPNNVISGNFMGLALDGVTPLATAGFQVLSVRDGNIIQGNRMAYSTSAGIWVDGAQTNTIRRNSIYANPFKGIFLDNAANNDLSAPIITLNASEGSGTACPNCTIELFLDASNQGRVYLDTLLSDASGHFQFPYYCPLAYTNLTATATDTYGNTSPFSEASSVPWNCNTARPAPSLSDISPDSQQAPSATVALQVSGANFAPDSIVRWNGQNLPTSYLSPTALQTVIPSYLLQDGGSIPVSVFTPLPGGGESAPLVFTILPPWKIFLPLTRK